MHRKYCSEWCRRKFDARKKLSVQKVLSCDICGSTFLSINSRSKYCSRDCGYEMVKRRAIRADRESRALLPEFKTQICRWCNGEIVTPRSYTGTKLYHDDCRVKARRHNNRKKTVKRQGAKSVERIDIFALAERDGFVCYLCSEIVDMSMSRTSRLGATVDHVVPISRGGLDEWSNVRLAHWICNVRKSNNLEFVDA